jgi:hypothetical protein
MHYHHCPECYEKWQCNFDCTIEPDLEDRGRQFGAHCICNSCEKEVYYHTVLTTNDEEKYKHKEFWDAYNGFVKVRKRNVGR